MKITNFLKFSYLFFLVLPTIGFCNTSFEEANTQKLESIFCHYTQSIEYVLKNSSMIPNSLMNETGGVNNAVNLYQPRFLQVTNNSILIARKDSGFQRYCNVNGIAYQTSRVFRNLSANYSVIFPHLRHLDHTVATEYPRNIYELGDWAGISMIQSSVSSENKILLDYTNSEIEHLYKLLSTSDSGYYDFNFRPIKGRFEVGHLTLAIDALSLYSYQSGEMKYVELAIKLIENLASIDLLEDANQKQYTHLATYGEIFESLTLARYVQNQAYSKDALFEKLYYSMKTRFSDKDKNLFFVLNRPDCHHSLAFEGALYRPLLYFYYNSNQEEVGFINNQIQITESVLGVPPIGGKCSEDNLFADQNVGALGIYYMYLKMKRIQSILGMDVDAEAKISRLLDNYFKFHQAKFFAYERPDSLKGLTKDMGGNVWFFNEGIVPVLYSYINPESLVGKQNSFQGCNFYFMPGLK